MNKRDTEIIKGVLSGNGFSFSDKEEDADIILFNTCSVRQHAEERVFGKMGMFIKQKESNPNLILGVIGCMAKFYGKDLFKKLPGLDIICSPGNIHNLKNDLEEVMSKKESISDIKDTILYDKYNCLSIRDSKISAWVSIMEGCENFCSYCVVPYTRGKEISRSLKDILNEVKYLVNEGFKEITLLGQNVNSYSCNGSNFIDLLKLINDKTNIKRIRFTTSHPKDTSSKLFKAMSDLDKVCPHLHLPLQSGSDKILKFMNRKYTSSKYKCLIDNLRKIYPECNITTDIIVGFPTETDKDFRNTYDLMKQIKFDSSFIFKYSPRIKTKAFELEDDVTNSKKKERNNKLLELQNDISFCKNKKYVNKKINVLVEARTNKKIHTKQGSKSLKNYIGRSLDNRLIFLKGSKGLVGKEVEAKIIKATPHTLIAIESNG